jgi:eukaryotic-like serine/threonine-protein kinase
MLTSSSLPPTGRVDVGDDGPHVRLGRLLGTGTSASVYHGVLQGRHGVGRSVALKLFSPVASDEAERVAALLAASARRLACVDHPNVAALYDFGVWHTQPFFVSELVSGVTLEALVARHAARGVRLPLDLALFVAVETAEGLSGAWTAEDHAGSPLGVLHLGLSAREILLSWRGEVKVTDFEADTARAATSSVRSLRGVARRAAMMAPEIAQGGKGDARSDVFSVGVLLRELLIGPRFPGGLTDAQAIRLAREGFVQPMSFQPHLPGPLAQLITTALSLDPAARHRNATALAYELRRVAFSMGIGDGRFFLRRALEREASTDTGEITVERRSYPDAGEGDEPLAHRRK